MTKTEYRQYIASPEWQQTRKSFLFSNYKCNRCGVPRWLASLAYDQDLHVHHLAYRNLGHEDWDDLEALCRRCHEIETFGRSTLKAPWSTPCVICKSPCFDRYQEPIITAGFLCSDCVGVDKVAHCESYRTTAWGDDTIKNYIEYWWNWKPKLDSPSEEGDIF